MKPCVYAEHIHVLALHFIMCEMAHVCNPATPLQALQQGPDMLPRVLQALICAEHKVGSAPLLLIRRLPRQDVIQFLWNSSSTTLTYAPK